MLHPDIRQNLTKLAHSILFWLVVGFIFVTMILPSGINALKWDVISPNWYVKLERIELGIKKDDNKIVEMTLWRKVRKDIMATAYREYYCSYPYIGFLESETTQAAKGFSIEKYQPLTDENGEVIMDSNGQPQLIEKQFSTRERDIPDVWYKNGCQKVFSIHYYSMVKPNGDLVPMRTLTSNAVTLPKRDNVAQTVKGTTLNTNPSQSSISAQRTQDPQPNTQPLIFDVDNSNNTVPIGREEGNDQPEKPANEDEPSGLINNIEKTASDTLENVGNLLRK